MTEPAAPSPRPRRRWLRWALLAVALLVLLPLAGAAAFLLTFDPNAAKPRIEAAVEAATGRALTIGGPIGAKLSLRPTITLEEVALANPPGFSRPALVQARRVEVQLAVLPLLSRRIELHRVQLDGADLLLERDAEGRPNWVFAPPIPAEAPPAAPAASRGPSRRFALHLDRLLLTEAAIGWRGAPAQPVRTLSIRRLEAEPKGAGDGLRLGGALALQDLPPLTLEGETGPLAALLAAPAPDAPPWPLRLALTGEGGLGLRAEGTLAPSGAGYRLAVAAQVPDLGRLAPLLPDLPLPPLRGLEAAAVLAGQGGGAPAVSDLRLSVGESALGLLHPDLVLERATLSVPAPDRPAALEAAARIGAAAAPLPVTLAGTLGPPAALLGPAAGPPQPWPVNLRVTLGAARLTVGGSVADPRAGTGFDLALTAAVPDLAALAPLLPPGVGPAGGLPPLRDIALETRLAERGPFFAQGAVLRDLRLTAPPAGDLAGTLTYATRPRQELTGQLASTRLDLDALRAAARPAAPATPAQPAAPAPAAPAPAPAPPSDRRVIPDLVLPLEALRLADGELRLTVQTLRAGGADWREVAASAAIREGRARFDPVAVTLPGGAGRVTLRAAADITADPPVVQLAVQAEGLDLAAIPAAGGASGRLTLEADLRGRGRELRTIAAGVFGHLGLTLREGSLPPRLLEGALAGLRQRVPAVGDLAARPLELGCVAARLEAQEGIARPRVLLAETSLGRLGAGEGAGRIRLRDETLDLRLNADLRLPVPGLGPGGVRIRAPVPVTGTLAAPRLEWNAVAGSALAGEVANQAERALGQGAGQLLGALGGAIAGGAGREQPPGPIPDCAAAVAIARGGQAPAPAPAPAPAAPSAEAPRPAPPAPAVPRDLPAPAQELLRRLPIPGLFGR